MNNWLITTLLRERFMREQRLQSSSIIKTIFLNFRTMGRIIKMDLGSMDMVKVKINRILMGTIKCMGSPMGMDNPKIKINHIIMGLVMTMDNNRMLMEVMRE